VSFAEEGLVMFMLWLATNHPVIFGITLLVVLVLSVLLIITLWKFLRMVMRKISSFFSGSPQTA
jgi:membrane protein implicated in regulation of membrane protease activity